MRPDGDQRSKPKLRFPEFRTAGDWEKMKLSDLLRETKQRNRDLTYGPNDVLSVSGEFGCVNQIELLGRSYAGVSVKDYHVVETGDVVYTKSPLKRNPYGIIKANKRKPGIVSTLYAVYRTTDLGLPEYLDHYFSRDYNLNSYLQPIVRKGAKNDMKVNNADVLGGEIWAPKRNEQQKISACLTSLDDLVASHGQKLGVLKSYKKALMLQLFPRDGETIPRLRFPEFRRNGAWKEGKAGGMFMNRLDRGEDGLPIYSVTIHDGMVRRDSLERNYYDIEEASGNKKACKDDIAYNMMRMWQGALGVAPEDCLVSPAYIVLAPKKHTVSRFFEYLFKLPSSLQLLTSYSRGLTKDRLRLYFDDFAGIRLCYPSDPQEQQRIADCLASLDEAIIAQTQVLAALKTHKTGLMQQLFLSPEEVEA
jgi:type I restriction enzyme, S subunit